MDLTDRTELSDLLVRLGRWLDEKRFAEAPELFTDDASADTPGGTASGREALVAQARRTHADGVTSQHFITDPLIDTAGDRATIEANLLVVFAGPAGRRLIGERYRLSAARARGEWRISRVEARPIWEIADV